jgi:hypothetical protein
MRKKIKSSEQTKKLSEARWEFLQRNPEKKKEYEDQEVVQSFRARFKKHPDIFNNAIDGETFKDCDEFLKGTMQRSAAAGLYHFVDLIMKHQNLFYMADDEINTKWMNFLIKNAREIFQRLTYMEPKTTLLLGIDLNRSKESIMAEVEGLVDKYQKFYRGNDPENTRLKWLSILDEILQVWNLYDKAGQKPWQRSMKAISREVGRPLSTVKSQWRMAYEKIHGKPYNPESKFVTEEKKGRAAELCATCPHDGICYKSGEWYPCSDYQRVAGKERPQESMEFKDELYYDVNS